MSKYERGEDKPSYDFFFKLGEKFNVNLNWLFLVKGRCFLNYGTASGLSIKTVKIKKDELLQIEYED